MTDALGADEAVRLEAVDPAGSFIIQAPAGSGKTSLLTQRFLRLLAIVERPEEIVAMTFTRKAAAEMRHRIIEALITAESPLPAGSSAHLQRTRQLALAALANGRERGWDLTQHPSRLHIQTIDGLNHWLARRLPLSARLGLSPQLLDDARPAYAQAAQQFTSSMEQADDLGEALIRLAQLLDHSPARLEALLAAMLARRELWLPKLFELAQSADQRADMEGLLAASVEAELGRLRWLADVPLMQDLLALVREAAAAIGPSSPLWPLRDAHALPAARVAERPKWECLATTLLTKAGPARRKVDARSGFPPAIKALRDRMIVLLARLAEDRELVVALGDIKLLPPSSYTDAQWQQVRALMAVLVPAAATLQSTFAQRNQLDHPAVAAAAREALGAEDAPTELALALEYRVRHLLVDEYQDTSPTQQALLTRMVAGWQAGDGHTLFCVGDPMQSIYGFREADVTLFLEAQARGIGGVPLAARRLACNFRSCRGVVDWVNQAFANVLPAAEDYERGAVPYAASLHTRPDEPGSGVRVHAFAGDDQGREAKRIAEIVQEAIAEAEQLERADRSGGGRGARRMVAVLLRSRAVLPPILAELRNCGIDYRGVELESLSDRAAVRDILALARALLHVGDRSAWLAVLRAPWCGLTLADLHALAASAPRALIIDLLRDPGVLAALSADGTQRCASVLQALVASLRDRGRRSLGSWVRAAWLALGGPATLFDASDLDNAETCFSALDEVGREMRGAPSAIDLETAVAALMASPVGRADARVQLMTIHKAKGLEFDTVILPCLGRGAARAETQLMYWANVAAGAGRRGIVLAGHGEAPDDALEAWMKRLDRERRELELGRLAYVAATRARRTLHLVGSARLDRRDDGLELKDPPRDSLLAQFWPALRADFQAALAAAIARGDALTVRDGAARALAAPPVSRLCAGFSAPPAAPAVPAVAAKRAQLAGNTVRPDFDWAGVAAVAVGTVVHAELERIARRGLEPPAQPWRPARWRDRLQRLGLPPDRLDDAAARVGRAMSTVCSSRLAAGLLDPGQREAASEFALTAYLDGELVSIRIDRTFVDEEGVRWIVDWKVSAHEGGSLEEFLRHELERYADQLHRYARIMRLYDGRPQKIGLYFPLLDAWREWRPPVG